MFKFKNKENNLSKEISSLNDDNENNKEKDKKNVKVDNKFKPDRAIGDIDQVDKIEFDNLSQKEYLDDNNNINNEENNEKQEEENYNNISNYNETKFYELNTNKIVDIIKNDYDDIYIKQNEEITKFVDKLAKENSSLKQEINKLKSENIKLKTQNNYYQKLCLAKKEINTEEKNKINRKLEINLEKYEKEKENLKNEYENIIINISSSLVIKYIKSLYEKLINSKDDLFNSQKIIFLLQDETDKLKEENEFIKSTISEEKNKIIEKIIEIQEKTNSKIELNKNLLFNKEEEENSNNIINNCNNKDINNIINPKNDMFIFYTEKIKNLTYEKNKLLSCNYDFFLKLNDLSKTIEEKNNTINEHIQKINSLESQLLNSSHENKTINLKYNESLNIIKDLQDKNKELINKKESFLNLEEKLKENKSNNMKTLYETKISKLNDNLTNITKINEQINSEMKKIKDNYDNCKNNSNLYKSEYEKALKEKNVIIKELNKVKTELKLKEEQSIVDKKENEQKIQKITEEIENKYKDKIEYSLIQSSINSIYNSIISKNNKNNFDNNNQNNNISNFISKNINDISKLNEINKYINNLYYNQRLYSLIKDENEKLKAHIKEITNITLENTSLSYIQKFCEDFNNDISIEQLLLKIIDYIKVIKICFLLQKIKTIVKFGEKYINWLNEKEYFKANNTSIKELKDEINNINNEIDIIKNTIKNNSLNLEKKFKNFLSKEEVKNKLNDIQKKYENIISDLFEYFLKYKIINDKGNKEFLILKIPINSYNLMIENNMNNISLIGQSIESWNLYINNELDYINNNYFREIIDLTNIQNLLEYNNINDIIQNNESTNNNNINDFVEIRKDNENISENNESGSENDTNKNNDQSSHLQGSKSQYSFDNKNT